MSKEKYWKKKIRGLRRQINFSRIMIILIFSFCTASIFYGGIFIGLYGIIVSLIGCASVYLDSKELIKIKREAMIDLLIEHKNETV